MMYLFDINVISELTKRQPNQNVVDFFNQLENNNILGYLSTVTIGEIEFGIEKLKYRNDFAQSARLRDWYNKNLPKIAQTTLDFDENCAKIWGNLMAKNP